MVLEFESKIYFCAVFLAFFFEFSSSQLHCSNPEGDTCKCSIESYFTDSGCSGITLDITKEDDAVAFFCKNANISNINAIPALNVGSISNISIFTNNCSLANEISIQDIMQRWSIDQITIFKMESDVTQLPNNFFHNLFELEFIALLCPKLQKLDAGTFKNLNKLETVTLSTDSIKSLPNELFVGASAVEMLLISGDNVEILEPNIFENFIDLAKVILALNRFSVLPEELLRNNKKLKEIILSDNQADLTLPSRFLAQLPLLESVDMSVCRLFALPEDLFVESENIVEIKLSMNKLAMIPETIFNSQVKLVTLDLSFNDLTSLPEALFRNTKDLRRLNLAHNQIQVLPDNLFSFSMQFHELTLRSNQIQHILSMNLPISLEKLDISDNKMNSIDESIFNRFNNETGMLQELSISRNTLNCDEKLISLIRLHSEKVIYDFTDCEDGADLSDKIRPNS